MAYVIPTAAELKVRFPEFSAVDDTVVDARIEEAARMVDETWTEGDYALAIMLYACHIMALEGLGTGPDSQANTGQMANFQTIRSGQLTLTRGSYSHGGGDTGDWYASTRYGSRFWRLLKLNKGGPTVAIAAAAIAGVSGYAKDGPLWSIAGLELASAGEEPDSSVYVVEAP